MYWREQSITRVFALLTGLAVAIDGILTLDSSTVDWPPVLPCAVFTLCPLATLSFRPAQQSVTR
jgi:hypothetical protein